MKISLGLLLVLVCIGVIIGLWIEYYNIPFIIEDRMKELNLMKYNSEKEKFELKSDSLKISKWDLYYIQHGIMK